MADIKKWAFPNGQEGLLSGPIALGPGEVDPDAVRRNFEARMQEADEAGETMEALAEALEPQRERARQDQARASQAEEERAKDAPFKVLMRELNEMFAVHDDELGEGRSELEMTLYKIDKVNGAEKTSVCHKERRSPEEAVQQGVPDLEGIAMEYAKETGQFGAYAWKIRGWLKGETVKQTTMRLHIAPPMGYVPPKPQAEPEPKKDPMDEMGRTFAMIRTMRESLGIGGESTGSKAGELAASAMARLEADREHRKEIYDMTERHRRELEDIRKAEYERGFKDGERDTTHKLERKIWELEHDNTPETGATWVQDLTGALGGPQAVQSLVGGIVGALQSRPKTAPPQPRPLRPMPPRMPQPIAPPVQVNPTPSTIEPTRAQVHEALTQLAEARELLEGAMEDAAFATEYGELLPAIQRMEAEGLQDGPLAEWWSRYEPTIQQISALIEALSDREEEDPAEEPMDAEALKALLLQRLEEGRSAAEIMDEFRATVPDATRKEWAGMLKWAPMEIALAFLGIPEHLKTRAAEVVQAFKAD